MNLADSKIAQILIPVEDFDKGVAFYRDILGLTFLFSAPPQMAFFHCDGVRLLVGVLPPTEKRERGTTIYFQVSDIQEMFRSLEANGVHFKSPPHVVHKTTITELWLAEFADPDGNPFALMGELPLDDRPISSTISYKSQDHALDDQKPKEGKLCISKGLEKS